MGNSLVAGQTKYIIHIFKYSIQLIIYFDHGFHELYKPIFAGSPALE